MLHFQSGLTKELIGKGTVECWVVYRDGRVQSEDLRNPTREPWTSGRTTYDPSPPGGLRPSEILSQEIID